MSEAIHLYVITDDPEKAAMGILGCPVASLPKWIKVVNDPFEVEKLPSNISAMGLFFPFGEGRNNFIETVWRERRERGDIDYDFGKHFDKLTTWLQRRDEADKRRLAAALEEKRLKEKGETA